MPTGFIKSFGRRKTKKSHHIPGNRGKGPEKKLSGEEAWRRAKEVVSQSRKKTQKQFSSQDWGLVTKITKKMFGREDMDARRIVDTLLEKRK